MSRPHEATECDSESARLLPWHLTGQLDADEAARVEAHVQACAVCRADLEQQRELRAVLRGSDRVDYAPQPSLQKLMIRIDELDRELPDATPTPAAPRAVSTTPRRFAPTRWLVAALLVQTVGLGLLCTLLWGRSTTATPAASYKTLTAPPSLTAGSAAQLRVVFAPGTTVEAMGQLLREAQATIVSGPSEAGAYALALAPARAASLDASLGRLRTDARVVFAEPIVDTPATVR
jgi:anti-sigma factor RsiW